MANLDDILKKYEDDEEQFSTSTGLDDILGKYESVDSAGPLDDVLNKYEPVENQEEVPTEVSQDLTPDDLLKPENYKVVSRFLIDRFGITGLDKMSKEDKVDKFLNTMRYSLGSGNTVYSAIEIDHMLSSDDESAKSYADGVALYQKLGGVIGGDYSRSETLETLKDYGYGVIADPINVVLPLIGKAVVGTASRAGTKTIAQMATTQANKAYQRQIAKGASEEVARYSARKVYEGSIKNFGKKFGTREAVAEIAATTAADAAIAAGVDIAQQNALIEIDAQEDYNKYQTGLAALGGIVGGGIAAGVVGLRGTSRLTQASSIKDMSVEDKADLKGVMERLSQQLNNIPEEKLVEYKGTFKEKVMAADELTVKDTKFFGDLILGNDEVGFVGLVPILKDQGFVWRGPRAEEDNFTNWLADAMRNAPEAEIENFVKSFERVTGTQITGEGGVVVENIANQLAAKGSMSGSFLNKLSQGAKALGIDPKKITIDDYADYVFGRKTVQNETIADKASKAIADKARAVSEGVAEATSYGQSSYLRLLVTHPGTSALNIAGWSTKSTMQSSADLLRGTVIYGSETVLRAITNKNPSLGWNKMSGVWMANVNKARNLLDPATTKAAFDSLVERNPEAFRNLTDVISGGVIQDTTKKFGVDATKPMYQQLGDKGIDALQSLALVKAQDTFSKSQEFMYNLDVQLVQSFGMGYRKFIARPDAPALLRSKMYLDAQRKAIDLTLENIMSKSYKQSKSESVRELGGFIEDFRKIPVVGAMIPFGRFFNNTVATLGEFSGASAALKPVFKGVPEDKSYGEVVAKAAIFWGMVWTMSDREMELMDRGVPFTQDVDERTGQTIDYTYDAPAIYTKAMGRIMGYWRRGEEIPDNLITEVGKIVSGQLTRQLTSAERQLFEFGAAVLKMDAEEINRTFTDVSSAITPTIASGTTRFLEPLNVGVALFGDRESYSVLDKKQGEEVYLKSLRYIDQFISDSLKEGTEPVTGTVRSAQTRQPGKIAGVRTVTKPTSASRVFSMIGRPEFDVGIKADDATAKAAVQKIFVPIFETEAEKLLQNPNFINGDVDVREKAVSDALQRSRNNARKLMQDYMGTPTKRLELIYKLTSNRKMYKIEEFMSDLNMKVDDIKDLSLGQLELLDFYMSNEDERLEEALK